MKKFLSLVLALVMTMSLVTISAGAKDFTDNSKIEYKEAVDVVSTIGIVDGYEDGAFNPTNELTRGAAAKIICNLILGPTTASALSADTAPYKDVPTNNNFAGYIAYCAQQGIISGYADGTFRPAAPLTGYAFMKMLLGALGYDSEIEGFVGANWSVQVGKLALGIGLDDGNDEFVGTRPVNREEACLYVFNTLQATMVQYDSKITANVNGAEVTIGNSKATPVEWATGKKNDGNIDKDGFVQFAEQYFDKLVLKPGTDDFARPANIWEYKSNEVGTYAKTPDASYSKKVEIGDIYKDLGLTKTVVKADVSVYVDGVPAKEHSTAAYDGYADDLAKQVAKDIKKGDDDNKYGASGVLTEVFFDEDEGTVTITEVSTYVGQVNKNVAATSKKDAYVQIATLDAVPGKTGNLDFETDEEFEEDAYVQFTFSEAVDEVKSVAVTESVTGTATKTVNKITNGDVNKAITIEDTEYKAAQMISGELLSSVSVKNDYTIYLDQYGYVLYIEEEELTAQDYALVLATANRGSFVGKKADLVFADGTSAVVTTEKDYSVEGSTDYIADYTIVSFKEDDGVYTLKPVSTKQSNGAYNRTERVGTMNKSYELLGDGSVDFKLQNDKASITIGAGKSAVTANSKTVFVVRDTDDTEDYTSYTGIKNAPSIEAANAAGKSVNVYYYCKSGSMATVMFVFPGKNLIIEDESNKLLYLAEESVSDLQHDANSDYFEYNAVVNGEIKTVKVDENVVVSGSYAIGKNGDGSSLNGLYKTYSVDKYGVITKVTGYDKYTGTSDAKAAINDETGIDKRSADYTVILGTKKGDSNIVVTVDDNAAYFTVDKKGNISTSSYRSVVKDDNDKVFGAMKDYLVQTLIVQTVEDEEKQTNNNQDGVGYEAQTSMASNGRATVRLTATRPSYVPMEDDLLYSYDVYVGGEYVATKNSATDEKIAANSKTDSSTWTDAGFDPDDVVTIENFEFHPANVVVNFVDGNGDEVIASAKLSAQSAEDLKFTVPTTAFAGTTFKYTVTGLSGKDQSGTGTVGEEVTVASVQAKGDKAVTVTITGLGAAKYAVTLPTEANNVTLTAKVGEKDVSSGSTVEDGASLDIYATCSDLDGNYAIDVVVAGVGSVTLKAADVNKAVKVGTIKVTEAVDLSKAVTMTKTAALAVKSVTWNNTQIVVTFTADVDASTVAKTAFTLTAAGGAAIADVSVDGAAVTLTLAGIPAADDTIAVADATVGAAADAENTCAEVTYELAAGGTASVKTV